MEFRNQNELFCSLTDQSEIQGAIVSDLVIGPKNMDAVINNTRLETRQVNPIAIACALDHLEKQGDIYYKNEQVYLTDTSRIEFLKIGGTTED